ncbi:MAG: hypothetical protein ABFD97_25500 [Syntrophobacter sp.]
MHGQEQRSWKTPEFVLVIYMLTTLTVLVFLILFIPPLAFTDIAIDVKELAKDYLEYRKTLLSIILTAFGAWIGAGAAYYFGRENMAEASRSLLAMKEPSPRERLRRTSIRLIPPKPLDWKVKTGEELKAVVDKLRSETGKWFIPIVKDDGTLENIVHEDSVWRMIDTQSAAKTPYDDIMKKKMSDVLDFVKKEKLERFMGIYVQVGLDRSAGEAYDLMKSKDVYLAIIVDDSGKPTHFIDTGDVRKLLLQVE